MESVQTKEVSGALGALTKHKARANKPINVVQSTPIVVSGEPKIEAATPDLAPVNPPATPNQPPEPQIDSRDYKESWKSLKTLYDTEISKARNVEKDLRDELAKAKTPQLALPKTKEEIEAYRKQYPEAMDVFTTIALETVNAQSQVLEEKLAQVTRFQNELKDKEAFKKLLDIHPDALEIRSSPKFLTWYNEQPRAIQDILSESTDITAVAKQLTLYKLEVLGINPKEQKATVVKDAVDASLGVDVKGRPEIGTQKKRWTQTEINAICADYKTYLKYRVEIDDARRENRVDYDK